MLRRSPQRGFTLVEVLVAFMIMSVVLFVTYRMFADVTEAVRLGIANSHVMGNARAAIDQIKRDTHYDDMVGPGSGSEVGMLVVVNRTLPDVRVDFTHPDLAGLTARTVRSDQLLFISRNTGRLHPVVPDNSTTFASSTSAAPHVRMWYGHGRRSLADGTAAPGPLGGSGFAHQLTLARQALFLEYNPAATRTHAQDATTDAPIAGGFQASVPAGIAGMLYDGLADIANWSLYDADPAVPALFGPSASTQHLETGMAHATYRTRAYELLYLDTPLSVNPLPTLDPANSSYYYQSWQIAQTHPYFIGNVSDIIIQFAADANNDDGLPDREAVFVGEAAGNVIATHGHPFADGAVVRVASDGTLPVGLAAGTDYYVVNSSGSVFQLSLTFNGAAVDITSAGVGTHTVSDGGIIWYDGIENPLPTVGAYDYVTQWDPASYDPHERCDATSPTPLPFEPDVFLWRHDDGQSFVAADDPANSKWPHLIRLRYRIHDEHNKLYSPAIQAQASALFTADIVGDTLTTDRPAPGRPFRNGARVRVRNYGTGLPGGLAPDTDYFVVDSDPSTPTTFQLALTYGGTPINLTTSGTGSHVVTETSVGIAGRWFEQIIRVKRP